MVAMSGTHRRPHIVVVVGGDAHELRAFDQERGVPDIGDAHLIGIERGELERGRHCPAADSELRGRDSSASLQALAPVVARFARARPVQMPQLPTRAPRSARVGQKPTKAAHEPSLRSMISRKPYPPAINPRTPIMLSGTPHITRRCDTECGGKARPAAAPYGVSGTCSFAHALCSPSSGSDGSSAGWRRRSGPTAPKSLR